MTDFDPLVRLLTGVGVRLSRCSYAEYSDEVPVSILAR